MYAEGFASKLKKARENTGFTQREVSKELKIPQIETIGILADFYEVSVDWLFGTKGKPSEDNYQHLKK